MTRKLTARKHVCAPLHQNVVPTESHNNGMFAWYFLRTLRMLLLLLGYGEPLLFVETSRLLQVIMYERSTTNHVHHICQVIEPAAPRWTFERGIWDAAQEALVMLHHEEDDQMEHSQYRHFLKVVTTYDALLTKWSWPMLWLEILMRSWRKSNSMETMEK
jgi:hypothetical protein